jgi:nucleotide-binding universal stress UspA family protein
MSVVPPRPWHGKPTGAIVVFGALPNQHPKLVQAAAAITSRMDGSLLCVWVDEEHVAVERRPDGTLVTLPLNPDEDEDPAGPVVEKMSARLEEILAGSPVPWRLYYTTGIPAEALDEVAEELDAMAIAIGTREKGLGPWVTDNVTGSVAVELAHRLRPLVLIPHPDVTSQQ